MPEMQLLKIAHEGFKTSASRQKLIAIGAHRNVNRNVYETELKKLAEFARYKKGSYKDRTYSFEEFKNRYHISPRAADLYMMKHDDAYWLHEVHVLSVKRYGGMAGWMGHHSVPQEILDNTGVIVAIGKALLKKTFMTALKMGTSSPVPGIFSADPGKVSDGLWKLMVYLMGRKRPEVKSVTDAMDAFGNSVCMAIHLATPMREVYGKHSGERGGGGGGGSRRRKSKKKTPEIVDFRLAAEKVVLMKVFRPDQEDVVWSQLRNPPGGTLRNSMRIEADESGPGVMMNWVCTRGGWATNISTPASFDHYFFVPIFSTSLQEALTGNDDFGGPAGVGGAGAGAAAAKSMRVLHSRVSSSEDSDDSEGSSYLSYSSSSSSSH